MMRKWEACGHPQVGMLYQAYPKNSQNYGVWVDYDLPSIWVDLNTPSRDIAIAALTYPVKRCWK